MHPLTEKEGNSFFNYIFALCQKCQLQRNYHSSYLSFIFMVGGVVASWLVRSTLERAVRVRALAGDSVLCSWARHFTLTTQLYKWVPAICWENLTKLRGSDLRWTTCTCSIPSRGRRNTSSRFMLQNRDKLRQL